MSKSPTLPLPLRRGPADHYTSVCLYADQARRLKALSERAEIPVSTLIRHAVQHLLDSHPEE